MSSSRSIRPDAAGSRYYQHSGAVPGASRLSTIARRSIYQRFLEALKPQPEERILDIGVTSDANFPESNFLERAYPYKDRLTCVGTEDGSHLERLYPGLRFVSIAAGEPLPFGNDHFDVVFSNAVVEHVGDTERQRRFVAEALRVSKRFFIVTPNRLFPVETHTGLPFIHYLPPRVFRSVLRRTRYRDWASEDQLNLLSKSGFARLFPAGTLVSAEYAGVGVGWFKSNLVAYGHSEP